MSFTEEDLKKKGFIPDGKGGWKKGSSKDAVDPQPERIEKRPPYIWMPMNVPSSKNSKQIKWLFKAMKGKVRASIGGKSVTPFIAESKLCEEYRTKTKAYWMDRKKYFHRMIEGMEKPYVIEFQFVRPTKRRFDFHNIVQLPCDLMVEFGWIEDDDINNILVIPPLHPRKPFVLDEKAGMYIRVYDHNKLSIVNK